MKQTILLAVETAFDRCSVALSIDGEIRSIEHPSERSHAEQLAPMISAIVREADLSASDITAVALSEGPGSYTGLRIGASTAKGLCYGTGAVLVPVPTLEAAGLDAYRRSARRDTGRCVVAVAFKARAKDVYWAVYDGARLRAPVTENSVDERTIEAACVLSIEAAAQQLVDLETDSIVLAGSSAATVARALASLDESAAARVAVSSDGQHGDRPLAHAVAIIGQERLGLGLTADLGVFEPAYLKQFVARSPKGSIFDNLQI